MKTIDVMPGDEWGFLESGAVVQYRNGRWRLVERERRNVGVWCGEPGDKHRRDPGEIELPEVAVLAILHAWGYEITSGEGEKPADDKCQAKAKPEILTDEAKPADVPTCAVHLRSDAHLSAVIGRVNGIADWMYALESRLAALEKPADKPAARVVKAPTTPDTGPMSNERFHGWSEGWCQADERWRAAVKDAGLTIADEGSKT